MTENHNAAMHGEVSLLFHLANADAILLPDEIANIYHHAQVTRRGAWGRIEDVDFSMENPMSLAKAIQQVQTHSVEEKLLLLEFLGLNCTIAAEVKLEEQQVLLTIIAGIFPEQEDIAMQFILNVIEKQAIFDAFGIPLTGMRLIH